MASRPERDASVPQPLGNTTLDYNPFIRELTDRILSELGCTRSLFQVPNGFVRCNKRKDSIRRRAEVYDKCLNTQTRFGNYPSVKELADDFGVPHSTILDNISRATRAATAERSGQAGYTGVLVEMDGNRQAENVDCRP